MDDDLGFEDEWLLEDEPDGVDDGEDEEFLGFLAGDFAADTDFLIDLLGL